MLTPGARFCHRCGAPAGATAPVASATPSPPATGTSPRSILPWAIGTAALLAVVIAVAVQQREGAPLASGPNVPLDGSAPFASGQGGAMAGSGVVRAPDISSMSPRERADRLYDRVMRLSVEGKGDSAAFFADMAAQAYDLLGPLDDDLKYDAGRMAEMAGNLPLAKQRAESILQGAPDHLLGLILRARVAELEGDTAARTRYLDRFLAVRTKELAKNLEEYQRHRGDIDAATTEQAGER